MSLISASTTASALTLSRDPYLQNASPESITIRWRTDQSSDSVVNFGTDAANLTALATAAAGSDHEVTLSGLLPDARYYYNVGDGVNVLADALGVALHSFVTPPPIGQAKSTRIWVLGDPGINDGGARAVRDRFYDEELLDDRQADLVLMLGDNAYSDSALGLEDGSDASYQNSVFGKYSEILSRAPIWPVIGNHDVKNGNISVYLDIFTLPQSLSGSKYYYAFDYGNIHFIALDSMESSRDRAGAMYTWLQSDLAATTADWIIAFWHHPPYSKGSHDSDLEQESIDMRENFVELLESFGVDLVLSGHSHSYERSYLLDQHYGYSSSFDAATHRRDSGDGRLNGDGAYQKQPGSNQGAVYLVTGSAGQIDANSEVAFMNGDAHPAMFSNISEQWGSVIVDLDGEQLDATFLTKDGAILDHFSLQKSGLGSGDHTPPVVQAVQVADANTVLLLLSETPATVSSTQFSFDAGVSVQSAVSSGALVTLTTTNLPTNTPLILTISGIEDAAGNWMADRVESLSYTPTPSATDPTSPTQSTPLATLEMQQELLTETGVVLSWQPYLSAAVTLYRVSRDGVVLDYLMAADLVGLSKISFQDQDLSPESDYLYEVLALGETGQALASGTLQITTSIVAPVSSGNQAKGGGGALDTWLFAAGLLLLLGKSRD